MTITEYTINAAVENDVRFVFVSDLHDRENAPIIEAIRGSHADAVLVGGDFIHNSIRYERGFEFLRDCADILPTLCSLGNHEMKYGGGDLFPRIHKTGATLLDNSYCNFKGINIGGLSTGYKLLQRQSHFERTPAPDIDFVRKFSSLDGFKLLLSHHPEYYPKYIKDKNIDLTLSGHAHGGQWRFFGQGVYSPGQGLFPKYTSGMYEGKLIVSRGLSILNPIPRIQNQPEMLIINIVRLTK